MRTPNAVMSPQNNNKGGSVHAMPGSLKQHSHATQSSLLRLVYVFFIWSLSLTVCASQIIIDDDFHYTNLLKSSDRVVLPATDNYRDALNNVSATTPLGLFDRVGTDSRTWTKTELVNQGPTPRQLVLTLYHQPVDEIQFYIIDSQFRIVRSASHRAQTTTSDDSWPTPYLYFPVSIDAGEAITLVTGIRSHGSAHFRMGLWDARALEQHERLMLVATGVLSGMLLIALGYFLFSYVLQHAPARFWLALVFALSSAFVFATQGGLTSWPWIASGLAVISVALLTSCAMALAKVMHALFARIPGPLRVVNLVLPLLIFATTVWISPFDASLFIYAGIPIIGVFQTALVLRYRDRRHPELSQFFTAGWLCLIAIYALMLHQAIAASIIGMHIFYVIVGLALFAILLFSAAVEGKERSVSAQQMQAREQTISSLHQFYDLFRNSAEGLYTSTLEGTLKSVNPAMCTLFGYPDEATMLAQVSSTREFYADPNDRELLLGELLENGQVMGKEIRGRRADNAEFWFSISCQIHKDENGSFMYGSIFDITERKQTSLSLEFMATHDALTGVFNRREFEHRLAEAIAEPARNCTLLYLDMDRFKVVNDTCGHKAGDELIKEIAALLDNTLDGRGMLARLGGDEFGILFTDQVEETAYLSGIQVMNAVQAYRFVWDRKIFTLGVSIGMVVCNEISDDPEQCLSMADAACYYAKEQGRNQIHRFRKDDQAMLLYKNELDWVTAINHALEHDDFVLFYQSYRPLKKASSQAYFEILLRLRSDSDTLLGPGSFLPVAERYNLSVKIDKWVIEHTFRWLSSHPQHLSNIARVSINLCGQSLADRELKLHALNMFERYCVPYEKVCFEITESVAVIKLDTTLAFMRTFTQLGCTFALDDFGSGFSSYNYLKNLPVSCVKIDGSFIRDMLNSSVDTAVVSSITDVAGALGMETVGEYVESEAIMTELGKIGVDYAQGFGVAKPEPLSDFG